MQTSNTNTIESRARAATAADVRDRYISLLKDALTFSLWPEPPAPVRSIKWRRVSVKRPILRGIDAALRLFGYGLVKIGGPSQNDRETGNIWPQYADTMIGRPRIENLQFAVETVLKEGVRGDFIETGVWRGGACIFMRGLLAAHEVEDRTVYVADSFQGLPRPDRERYPTDDGDRYHTFDALRVSEEQVRENFRRYGLLDDHVKFLKGWFKDTLPNAKGPFAVIRLDGDMYSSTMDAISALYPKLSPGGFCIVDDYALDGCRRAITDYRAANGIAEPIAQVDWTGAYWRKR